MIPKILSKYCFFYIKGFINHYFLSFSMIGWNKKATTFMEHPVCSVIERVADYCGSIILIRILLMHFWILTKMKCDFPMNHHVHLLVSWCVLST